MTPALAIVLGLLIAVATVGGAFFAALGVLIWSPGCLCSRLPTITDAGRRGHVDPLPGA